MIPRNNDLRIEVTTKCNYNCTICPRDRLTRKQETMSLSLFREVVDKVLAETNQYTTLTFPGMGEPLLDPTIDEKIEFARKKGLTILMLTNGSLLTVERFRKLEALGVESVRVSFYGNGPDSYAKVHGIKGKGAFESVRDNLAAIARIKKNTKLLMTFNVVDGSNDDCVQGWIEYWKGKADLLEVWRPHNWVDGRKYRKVQQNMLPTCGRPFKGPLQVQVDGTVNMCCFDYDGKLTVGDLKTQSLDEIFRSPMCMRLKRCHETGNFAGSGLICESCDQRNVDKTDVMVYDSKFNIEERVQMISTTYKKVA